MSAQPYTIEDVRSDAYPHLLPGFFTLVGEPVNVRPIAAWLPPVDRSAPNLPGPKRRGRCKPTRAYRRLRQDYLLECAAAISVLFEFADVVHAGDAIVVTAAMSAADFDLLAQVGSELAELENDDPGEDCGDLEAEPDKEDCHRDLPFADSAEA